MGRSGGVDGALAQESNTEIMIKTRYREQLKKTPSPAKVGQIKATYLGAHTFI